MELNIFSKLVSPITDLIDEVITSDDERNQFKLKLEQIRSQITIEELKLKSEIATAQSKAISAEVSGDSWLQKNWRPITMLTFLVMVLINAFGWFVIPLSDEVWTLLQVGIGGYIGGRSLEKITHSLRGSSGQ